MGTPQFCFRFSLTPERRFHFSIYRVHSRSEDGGGPHFRAERHPAGDAAPEDHGHGQALRRVRRAARQEYQELTKYRPPAAKRSHQVPL